LTELGDAVERRKGEHLRVAAEGDVGARRPAGWDDIHLVHQALPDVDLAEVDVSADFLGRKLAAPLVIAGMTGGHSTAQEVNRVLARVAERRGLAMGVGSQRAALSNPALAYTYRVARQEAPTAFLIANLGVAQLISQSGSASSGVEDLLAAVEMIRADALALHLNYLEESVQPEGDRRAAGVREAVARATSVLPLPVIAKETGAGISREAALALRDLGCAALDLGGAGGTSFAAVEGQRAAAAGDRRGERLGETFRDWGVPTAVSILAARAAGLPIIATGGVRSGLDAAKAIALGARLVGVARPLLTAALRGEAAVEEWIEHFCEELRVAVFLCGGRSLADLAGAPRVILGETEKWAVQLGHL
jgi:isopentenyl-diphosphate Delta-isomerase